MPEIQAQPLPQPGDLSGQLAQGGDLLTLGQEALGGNTSAANALVKMGVTTAASVFQGMGGQSTSPGAKLVRILTNEIGGAAQGFAVGGPVGGFVGMAVGAITASWAAITGELTYAGVIAPVTIPTYTRANYSKLMAWVATSGFGLGVASQNPMGWTLADYLSRISPPSNSPRPDLYLALLQAISEELIPSFGAHGMPGVLPLYMASGSPIPPPASLAWPGEHGSPMPTGDELLALSRPLASPVWWYWMQPTTGGQGTGQGPVGIQDVIRNTWFGGDVPDAWAADDVPPPSPPDLSQLENAFGADVIPPQGMTPGEVVRRAVERAPDPLYFSSDLYSINLQGRGGPFGAIHQGGFTTYVNLDLLIAMATVLGLLSIGASTRSIVSELLTQAKAISLGGSPPSIGLRALLDDYTILGHYEESRRKFPGWHAIKSPAISVTAEPTRPVPAPRPPSAAQQAAGKIAIQRWLNHYLGTGG